VNCEECGKALGFFRCYQHPIMGKKHALCSTCFDQVNASVSKWQEFVLQNSFNNQISNINSDLNCKNITPNLKQTRNILKNVSAETSILLKK